MESTRSTTPSYEPLLAEDEKDIYEGLPTILSKNSYGKERRSRWWEHRGFALLLLVVYSLVLLKLPSLWSSQRLDPFLTYSMWLCSSLKRAIGNVTDVYLGKAPAKEAIKEYHRHSFDGSLGLENKFTGEPRPDAEEAWAHLFKHYNLRFTHEEMEKLNRTDNPIELSNGGGYFGQISAYHHLHCLSMLRKVLWHDFYNISIPALRGHADHCINDIRQSLMCHADLSVVTFYWHPEMRKPMPNFHIDQTCVNWDALDKWASKRSFSVFDQKTLVHPQLGKLLDSSFLSLLPV